MYKVMREKEKRNNPMPEVRGSGMGPGAGCMGKRARRWKVCVQVGGTPLGNTLQAKAQGRSSHPVQGTVSGLVEQNDRRLEHTGGWARPWRALNVRPASSTCNFYKGIVLRADKRHFMPVTYPNAREKYLHHASG